MQESILQSVGRTPLVRLRRLAEGLQASVHVKLESLNPGGSIKDRVGVAMVEEAERRGWLRPGGTIIEATAGNTGVGLALAAAVRGYRCIFVLPDKMSGEKIRLLKAYGAEIVITPTGVPPDSPDSYNGVADRLAREVPGARRPNQFSNMANPEIHYRTTGPEIWEQTEGRITAFVAGVGTGGTISGVGRYLKERNPEIKVIGADPEGSVLSGDSPRPWKVEGIGEDFVPKTLNGQMVDDWIRVGDAESFHTARALARVRGPARRRLVRDGRGRRAPLRPTARGRRHRRRPLRRQRSQLHEQVLRRRLADRERHPLGCPAGAHDRRPAPGPRAAPAGDGRAGDHHRGGRGAAAIVRDLAVARPPRRRLGRQHPGGHAGPGPARQQRPEPGDRRRGDGQAVARSSTSGSTSTRSTACSCRATRASSRRRRARWSTSSPGST